MPKGDRRLRSCGMESVRPRRVLVGIAVRKSRVASGERCGGRRRRRASNEQDVLKGGISGGESVPVAR